MLSPVLTVPPAILPVSLVEAKEHLIVEVDDHDDLITGLIEAATAYLDGWSGILGRALITQSWRQEFNGFDNLRLALAPIQYEPAASPPVPVTVSYYDSAGAVVAVDDDLYAALSDSIGPYVALNAGQSWPTAYDRADAVSVTYVAGYGPAATDVPAPLRHAIKMLVAHWWENRAAVAEGVFVEVPLAVKALYWPYKRVAC